MSKVKSFEEIFKKIVRSPIFKGTFGEIIYKNLNIMVSHPKIKNIQKKEVLFSYKVTKPFLNSLGIAHGGALSSLFDEATTMAILKFDKKRRQSVSANLNINFLSPAFLNDLILLRLSVDKVGKNLAFSSGVLLREKNLEPIITGTHLKALLPTTIDKQFKL